MPKTIATSLVLLLYHHPLGASAPTIMEHVESFEKYSQFNVFKINTACGFPRGLESLEFSAIVLHYSLFGSLPFCLNERFRKYITSSKRSVKLAFFQDEMQHCVQRFGMINQLNLDVIFSLLEHKYFDEVYLSNTSVKEVRQTLTGYVCDDLLEKSKSYSNHFNERLVDVGYRARSLPFLFGRGAREKADIADKFIKASNNTGLKLDLSTHKRDRIYGDDWYRFVANCKFMLGVQAGVSIFDLTGEIKKSVDKYLAESPFASFSQVERDVLASHEERINYRTISPRIFECAVLRTCMILYKDYYQGVLTEGKHYIGLEKDFSNIDNVFEKMQDKQLVQGIVENAYHDLILSGKYNYREFLREFDETLVEFGSSPDCSEEQRKLVEARIAGDARLRNLVVSIKILRSRNFPGRETIKKIVCYLGYKARR